MRSLVKGPKPELLVENEATWLADWLADKTNPTKRFRYRARPIKDALVAETYGKCVYCESVLGVVHPGETEHLVPSSKAPLRHFDWANLTRACTECNRRKNNYYDQHDGFVSPYEDVVEEMFDHEGPVVLWQDGEARAEIAVKTLQLNSRDALVIAKTQALMGLKNLISRYAAEGDPTLRAVLKIEILAHAHVDAEYSAMMSSVLTHKGFL